MTHCANEGGACVYLCGINDVSIGPTHSSDTSLLHNNAYWRTPSCYTTHVWQIAGAGSAGCGVAATLLQGMVEQGMNQVRTSNVMSCVVCWQLG